MLCIQLHAIESAGETVVQAAGLTTPTAPTEDEAETENLQS